MTGLEIALLLALAMLLGMVMYLAQKLQRLHRRAQHLKHLVQKLEGVRERPLIYEEKGVLHKEPKHSGKDRV